MCTALNLTTDCHYFGRNLDLDRSYGEEVAVMPRRYPIELRHTEKMKEHYAIIGMATVIERTPERDYTPLGGLPLFYEGANEHGLAMAGLNFPGNAFYAPPGDAKYNIASFEFIPFILGRCKSLDEARLILPKINVCDTAFSKALPPSPLHWIISDKSGSAVVEVMKDGMHAYDNPYGVLTNNPPFKFHLENMEKYKSLRPDNSLVLRESEEGYTSYCQGLGAVGLPGDVSSMSRFVRASFGRKSSVSDPGELSSVGQFFHLLSSVEMVKGVCITDEGTLDITGYSACINTDRGLYYYTTYGNRRISCVDMHKTDLDGDKAYRFPLNKEESVEYRN